HADHDARGEHRREQERRENRRESLDRVDQAHERLVDPSADVAAEDAISIPMAAPMPTAITPTAIEMTVPVITRESTSRPYWSVPNRCAPDGPCRRPVIDIASGSCGV